MLGDLVLVHFEGEDGSDAGIARVGDDCDEDEGENSTALEGRCGGGRKL